MSQKPDPASPATLPPRLDRPIAEILARLETAIEFHREQEAFHRAHLESHQAQLARHSAELAKLTEHCEALKRAATSAIELVDGVDLPLPLAVEDFGSSRRPKLNKMVVRLIERLPPGQPLSASELAANVNYTFATLLKGRKVDVRQISSALRWLDTSGYLRRLRAGRPHREALYVRPSPRAPAEGSSAG
jgi:hypothetical protein